jgi:CO/xanthine dehydrogenase FAD-binding subunit
MATNLPGVFAGGDVTSGPSSVVRAIAAGRKAAQAIHSFLTGEEGKVPLDGQRSNKTLLEFDAVALIKTQRAGMPELPHSPRKIDQEDRPTDELQTVEDEAHRCANCGCVAVNASDLAPALIALRATIKTTKRSIAAEDFFAANQMRATVLDDDELITEIAIPTPRAGSHQRYLKFRIRNSIDFPIVSVASVLRMKNGKVKEASIALGGVAPLPLRAKEAEACLRGRTLDEAKAAEAAAIAVKGVQALAKNKFKAQIVRALLQKTIASFLSAQTSR